MAPYDHSSSTVEFLFKLHVLLPGAHTSFPELPPFLSERHTWQASSPSHIALTSALWLVHGKAAHSHPVPLVEADFLQGAHQAGGTVRRPEFGCGLELSQLQVEGVRMVSAVFTSERNKQLQVPCCDHRGCLFIHDFRHESQISALFLREGCLNVNSAAVKHAGRQPKRHRMK